MKKFLQITLLAGLVAFFVGCETTELELLESPNGVTVESADPNFILNDIQLTFNGIIGGYQGTSAVLVRMRNQFGSYNGTVTETTLRGPWASSYQMFANSDLLQGVDELTAEEGGIPYHIGIAYILEAYAYFLLVDYLGDVPYSEANNGSEFPNPKPDPGAAVYDAQLELLDLAIGRLNETSSKIPQDLYYGDFDASNWIALANSLKLRAYLNLRLTNAGRATSGINGLIGGNLITNSDKDFQFGYSTGESPESRHPFFTAHYMAGGVGGYMSNNFYDLMNAGDDQPPFVENGPQDPRTRYYFFRQDPDEPSGSNLPCAGDGNYDYCYVGNLYWGRDHADEAGIPNDGFKRTAYGIYPGGGAFDKDEFIQARAATETLGGEGIRPIYLSSFTNFALAEAALTLGTNGNAASYLEDGMRQSMNKIDDFIGNTDTGGFGMTSASINTHVNGVLAEYNGASNQGKLAIIAREWMIASWGNGIEPYNLYRRTGQPDLQAPIIPAGPFPRAFQYPNTETDGNPNIQPQPPTTQVFWDNNPVGFID